MTPLILASQSPRRKQLLSWAEISFEVRVKATDELFPETLTPAEASVYVARQKALAIAESALPQQMILAADTMVVLGDRIIGKPVDRNDAINILSDLSGREHEVITGVVLLRDQQEWSFYDSTRVRFHDISHGDIVYYVDKYQPFDKAGAYAIQEWIGVVGIHSVNGDFYNVMGLPVSRVLQLIRQVQMTG